MSNKKKYNNPDQFDINSKGVDNEKTRKVIDYINFTFTPIEIKYIIERIK